MGNIFSDVPLPPCELVLSFLCAKGENLQNLEDNLEALQRDMQYLNAMRNDLLRKVSREGERFVPEVKEWISAVETIEEQANRLLDESLSEIRRFSMYGYCSASTYRYSKKVVTTLERVKQLRSEGRFDVLTVCVEEVPVSGRIVSQEKLLGSTWDRLMDEKVGTLGIYGMGGVGKTTLLTQINNKFLETPVMDEFDLVIFVMVEYKEVENIQDQIGRRLGLHWSQEETKEEKAAEIYEMLKGKRFVLLLDDMPRGVGLEEMGVPVPTRENRCKAVFTTRHRGSSNWVDAEFEVPLLSSYEAWELFQNIVGNTTLTGHPEITKLARLVAAKCGGLPLALQVVGQTMAFKRTAQEWRYAVHLLNSSRAQFSGFKEILHILKFSYDALPGEKIKSCFLYCALFPEDFNIRSQDLINYWVGEGLISDETQGYVMIGELVRASLLMENKLGDGVKMHGIIHELALWVAAKKDHFVVERGEGIYQMPEVEDWGIVTRMSVTSTQIENISDSPRCSNLTTLLLQENNYLKCISGHFFRWMSSLVVLDLSHNRELSKLPEEISELLSLRYLSLLGTRIKDLPNGLEKLAQLIHLDLEFTTNLESIILVSGLLKLQVLKFYGSAAALDLGLLEKLKCMKGLKHLTITVKEVDVLEAFLGSTKLAECTQGLYLGELEVSVASFAATFGVLGSLSKFVLTDCNIVDSETEWEQNRRNADSPSTSFNPSNTWFKVLTTVELISCEGFRDLTWLVYAANLESLSVINSPNMEELISEEKAVGVSVKPFEKLQVLKLKNLDELSSIYWEPLSFPMLQKVHITSCPKLRKLPLNYMSVERIDDLIIEVDDGWADRSEWDSEATQQRFLPAIRTASVSQHHPVW